MMRNEMGFNRGLEICLCFWEDGMKKQDEFGMALCQSEYQGVQCDGHEGHGVDHFATVNDGTITWIDEVIKKETVESPFNWWCC